MVGNVEFGGKASNTSSLFEKWFDFSAMSFFCTIRISIKRKTLCQSGGETDLGSLQTDYLRSRHECSIGRTDEGRLIEASLED